MRILLDTTYTGRGRTGTGVYIRQLAAALEALGVEVVAAANEARGLPGGGRVRSITNFVADARWTHRELPRLARQAGADLIHHPLPAHSRGASCPQVVTVHDLAFVRAPQLFDRTYAVWATRAHRAAARRADVVICPSEATRRDVQELWGVDAVVARHGPGEAGPPVERGPARHFLYVGDDEPRKDLRTLRAAHRGLGADAPPLMIAGSAGEPVSTARLRELHAEAIALVHPGLIEGFGLTVLEALALGTPVIAARSAAVVEVAGEAAVYFPAGDVAALTASMRSLADDAPLRARLAAGGRARAADFSWEASARAHVAAYTLAGRR